MLTMTDASAQQHHQYRGYNLTWDGENRLTKLVPAVASTGARRISYAYDALSRRRSKSVEEYNGTSWVGIKTSFYRYQGWNVLSETVLLPTVSDVYHFYWGRDVSGSLQGAGGVGGLVAFYHGTGDGGYYHYDGNGNVTELSDLGTGEAIARYRYDAFGQLTSLNGTLVADDNTYRFSTKPIDAELNAPAGSQLGQGYYYYGYRFYNPAGGRWLSRDPMGESGGENLCGFCYNNGLYYIDPMGLNPAGHHLVPQSLTKDCKKPTKDKCDEAKNRLDNDKYNPTDSDVQHNNKKYNGISGIAYNKCVKDFKDSMFPNKDICKLTDAELQTLSDAIRNAPADSCLGKYNKGVEDEINKDTGKPPDHPLPVKPQPTPNVSYPPVPAPK